MRDIRNAELILIKSQEDFDLIKQIAFNEGNTRVIEGRFSGFGYYVHIQYNRRDAIDSCECKDLLCECVSYIDEYLSLGDYIKELEAEKAKLQELIDRANQNL